MRRALRRAGLALAVATSVSLVPVAVAPMALAQRVVSRAAAQARHETVVSADRPLEIRVELAWLDDPQTFPCQLAAHVTPEGLEVRGFVPSIPIHDRALRLARQYCPLPVIDQLHIHGSVAEHRTPTKAEHLQHAIAGALKAAFAQQVAMMHVTCNDQGQVTLTGSVGSAEDKLAVSQQLRRIP